MFRLRNELDFLHKNASDRFNQLGIISECATVTITLPLDNSSNIDKAS